MKSFTLGVDQLKTLKNINKVEGRIENSIKKLIELEVKSDKHNSPLSAINQVQQEIKNIFPMNMQGMLNNAVQAFLPKNTQPQP